MTINYGSETAAALHLNFVIIIKQVKPRMIRPTQIPNIWPKLSFLKIGAQNTQGYQFEKLDILE